MGCKTIQAFLGPHPETFIKRVSGGTSSVDAFQSSPGESISAKSLEDTVFKDLEVPITMLAAEKT